MKIKTQELTGAALDWAVTTLEDPEALRSEIEILEGLQLCQQLTI